MAIQGIDIQSMKAMRTQSKQEKVSPLNTDFATLMTQATLPAGAALSMNNQGYHASAMTAAAMTGVANAPASFGSGPSANAPYYSPTLGTATTPFAGGGYGYGGATYAPGYTGTGAGTGGGVGASYGGVSGSVGYGTPGAPSQDYQEKQALFQQMNDANWEMLVAQVTVNDLSRDYQARSNILKTKADAEANSVRNMKA